MQLSIVIPNYNGENLLKKNLPLIISCLSTYKEDTFEIIIIDDASRDNSISFLETFAKTNESSKMHLKIIKNEKNLGFSSTVNKGVKEVTTELFMLLNSDVVPEKEFLKCLLPHFSDKEVFAVGAMDKSKEKNTIVLRGRGVGIWKRGFLVHSAGTLDRINTLWVSGGSSMFQKKIWDELNGLNEVYNPFYWEDIDLSYRALKAGYKVLFEPKSVVNHEHEKGSIQTQYSQFTIKTIAYRNQFIFSWINMSDNNIFWSHVFWFPYHKLSAILRGDNAFCLGLWKAFLLLPKVVKARKKAQRIVKKSDKDVITSISS